jgi:hypothetical protein
MSLETKNPRTFLTRKMVTRYSKARNRFRQPSREKGPFLGGGGAPDGRPQTQVRDR